VNGESTHTTLFPNADSVVHWNWRSTGFAAKFYNRTERQIRKWAKNGLFARRGICVYQDSRGRWWIALDENAPPNLL
jgi:hypothetical protein